MNKALVPSVLHVILPHQVLQLHSPILSFRARSHKHTYTHSECRDTAAAPWPEAKRAEAYGLLGAKHVQSWSFCDGGINGWRGKTERCQGKTLRLFQLRTKLLTNKCKWTDLLIVLCKILMFASGTTWCVSTPQPLSLPLLDLAMQLNQGKFEYNGSCGWEQLLTPIQPIPFLQCASLKLIN